MADTAPRPQMQNAAHNAAFSSEVNRGLSMQKMQIYLWQLDNGVLWHRRNELSTLQRGGT